MPGGVGGAAPRGVPLSRSMLGDIIADSRARAPLAPAGRWRSVHCRLFPQHSADFRDLDAAGRRGAAGGGYPGVPAIARLVAGLDRAAPDPLACRSTHTTGV